LVATRIATQFLFCLFSIRFSIRLLNGLVFILFSTTLFNGRMFSGVVATALDFG